MPAGLAASQTQFASFVALCDDGTVWILPNVPGKEWEQLPPIPQPELSSASLPYENWGLMGNGPPLVPDGRGGLRKARGPQDAGDAALGEAKP